MPLGLCSPCCCWQLLDRAGWITGACETQVKLVTEDKTSVLLQILYLHKSIINICSNNRKGCICPEQVKETLSLSRLCGRTVTVQSLSIDTPESWETSVIEMVLCSFSHREQKLIHCWSCLWWWLVILFRTQEIQDWCLYQPTRFVNLPFPPLCGSCVFICWQIVLGKMWWHWITSELPGRKKLFLQGKIQPNFFVFYFSALN